MYQLELTPYGLTLKFSGASSPLEFIELQKKLMSILTKIPLDPKILIDITEMKPLRRKEKLIYSEIFKTLVENGLVRSCILYRSSSVLLQMQNISSQHDFFEEKYINIKDHPNFKRLSREWLVVGNGTKEQE